MTDGLKGQLWRPRYRSDRDDVVRDFYLHAYESSSEYNRASGYFTSTSLSLIGRGIDVFTQRGGVVRLIASPRLELDDIEDIARGYEIRKVFQRATMRAIEAETDPSLLRGLGIAGRLIAEGHLDIKLAFVETQRGFGLYHEKIGFFRDESGDVVAFTGSSNETYGGLIANFESVQVYRSWIEADSERAATIVTDFDELWNDQTATLHVMPFPEVAREALERIARRVPSTAFPPTDLGFPTQSEDEPLEGFLSVPHLLEPRDYQRDAIRVWLEHQGRGILKMATGTGKTKTALMAAAHVASVHRRTEQALVTLVIAPYQHLVDQWMDEVRAFGAAPIGVYESSRKWIPAVEDALSAVRLGSSSGVVLVATNASFMSDAFQGLIERVTSPVLLIGDEVHNLGSERLSSRLPTNATYRLGLSATPERYLDPDGTQRLIDYFGPVVFEIDLGKAIELGALCHYEYFPRLVELDEDEMGLYLKLTAQIAELLSAGESFEDADTDSPLGLLLRKRASVLGHASGKLEVLKKDVERHRQDWFQLVYCAEGSRPDPDGGGVDGPRQVEDALTLIGVQERLSAHTYVAETPREERQALLRRFVRGDDLRFLVSMRCLDEGVDIPDARIAYILASSSNPRQFVQRRGRLLRQVPGEKKKAIIYDYLAVPQSGEEGDFSETERSMVRRELQRALEFASLSDNYGETLRLLRPLKERYGLMDV